MNYDLALALRQNTCRRAHIYGAEWVIASKEARTQADPTVADDLLAGAAVARARYFRELESIDLLGGLFPSPFARD